MSVKTSLVVETFNPNTNKTKSSTATHANPNATNAQLNNFAQKMYGSAGLSANTINSVTRVDKRDITNAEEEQSGYILYTPSSFTLLNPRYADAFGADVTTKMKQLSANDAIENVRVESATWKSTTSSSNIFILEYTISYYNTNTEKTLTVKKSGNVPSQIFQYVNVTYDDGTGVIKNTMLQTSGSSNYEGYGMNEEDVHQWINEGKYYKVLVEGVNYLITNNSRSNSINVRLRYNETDNSLEVINVGDTSKEFGILITAPLKQGFYFKNDSNEHELYPEYSSGVIPRNGVVLFEEENGHLWGISLGSYSDWDS